MDKIDENYIQKRIQDSRKNWYVYFHSSQDGKDVGIIKANDERYAYIGLFNKFSHLHSPILAYMCMDNMLIIKRYNEIFNKEIDDKLFFPMTMTPPFFDKLGDKISSIFFSENQNEQLALDFLKYHHIKILTQHKNILGEIKIYIQKY